jgi:hypothetical protein
MKTVGDDASKQDRPRQPHMAQEQSVITQQHALLSASFVMENLQSLQNWIAARKLSAAEKRKLAEQLDEMQQELGILRDYIERSGSDRE